MHVGRAGVPVIVNAAAASGPPVMAA